VHDPLLARSDAPCFGSLARLCSPECADTLSSWLARGESSAAQPDLQERLEGSEEKAVSFRRARSRASGRGAHEASSRTCSLEAAVGERNEEERQQYRPSRPRIRPHQLYLQLGARADQVHAEQLLELGDRGARLAVLNSCATEREGERSELTRAARRRGGTERERERSDARIVCMPSFLAAARLCPMSSRKTASSAATPTRSSARRKKAGSGFLRGESGSEGGRARGRVSEFHDEEELLTKSVEGPRRRAKERSQSGTKSRHTSTPRPRFRCTRQTCPSSRRCLHQ